jgi:hypothetical protein
MCTFFKVGAAPPKGGQTMPDMSGLHIQPMQWGRLPELREAFPLDPPK